MGRGHPAGTPRQSSSPGTPVARWADVLCLVFLGALVLILFWRYITPDASARILFPSGDFLEQYYPWRYYSSLELAQGRVPLWTPFANSGHPFFADTQSAVLYPPHLFLALILWLRGDPQLTVLEFEWLVIFHVLLAGSFTYLLVRDQTKQRLAGLASSVAFALGSYMTTYPPLQPSILEVAAWAPLLLWLVDKAASRRSLPLWTLVGAVLTVPVLAGHPQQTTYLYYLVGAFGLFTILGPSRPEARPAAPGKTGSHLFQVGGLTLALVLSVGLASAQLLPSWELISLSARVQELDYQFTGAGFSLHEALGFLFPDLLGGKPMFIGTIPILLAAAGLRHPRIRGTMFWVAAAGAAYLLSFGSSLPVYRAVHCCLPGFSWFQDQERAISIFSLAGSVLSGYGLASLLRQAGSGPNLRSRTLPGVCAFLAAAAAVIAVAGRLAGPLPERLSNSALTRDAAFIAVVLGAASVLLYLARTGGLKRSLALSGLVAVTAAQLLAINWGNFGAGGENPFSPTPLTAFLQGLPPDHRIELSDLPSNAGYIFRLRVVRGAGPLTNKYVANALDTSKFRRPWPFLNTGYSVGAIQTAGEAPRFAYQGRGVYEMSENSAPAYVAFRARVEPDDNAVLKALAPSQSQPSTESFVLGRDALLSESVSVTPNGKGRIRSLRVTPDDGGHLVVQADTTAPGILVMSEGYYPGWKAFVDGREAKIARVNYLLRGVGLPPGPHAVHLVYQPSSLKAGIAVSIAAILVALGIGVASCRWVRRRKTIALVILALVTASTATVSWQSLPSYQVGTTRGQWEDLSQFLATNHLPGDTLVVPESGLASGLSLPGSLPWYRAADPSALSGHHRVWWLTSLDGPDSGPARPAPAEGWQVVSDRWFGNQLLSFLLPTGDILAAAPKPHDATLDGQVALRGYGLSTRKQEGEPPDALEVTLYWQALRSPDKDYDVFVHVLGQDGRISSQHDRQPAEGSSPTSGWEPGEVVVDKHVIPLPQALAPGQYSVIAGLYDAGDGGRLRDASGRDYMSLGQLSLGP